MTDYISNTKHQKSLPHSGTSRRVCLQQNKTNTSSLPTTNSSITAPFLLSNYYITNAPNKTSNDIHSTPTPINNSFIVPKPTKYTKIVPPIRTLKSSLRRENNPNNNTALFMNDTRTAITKSVHFDMPLAQVLHFYSPPPMDYNDDSGEEYFNESSTLPPPSNNNEEEDDNDEEEENMLEDAFLELFSKRLDAIDYDLSSLYPAIRKNSSIRALSSQLSFDDTPKKPSGLALALPNWPTTHPAKRFITQMVSLESLLWDDKNSSLKGRILVHNIAYQKKVTVRYSFNQWKTWIDIDANYKEPFSNGNKDNSAFDCFEFEIEVAANSWNKSQSLLLPSTYHLVVRYKANGHEFWDNNDGENFHVKWVAASPPSCSGKPVLKQESENNTKDCELRRKQCHYALNAFSKLRQVEKRSNRDIKNEEFYSQNVYSSVTFNVQSHQADLYTVETSSLQGVDQHPKLQTIVTQHGTKHLETTDYIKFNGLVLDQATVN